MMVAGFGLRAEATVESLRHAYERIGGGADVLAAPADKAGALCLRQLAAELGLKVQAVEVEDMQAVETPTQSAKVMEKRGTGSVAEACALAVAGANSRLIAMRHVSADRMATCALAVRVDK